MGSAVGVVPAWRERDGKQREGETLQEHSGSLIQMTALNQRAFFFFF